ncbi:odorant receptor 47b-like [Diprion similis]|uniref:odorant receptor 47b-like n=1 Tax=Diprion similis TaxID=362088 RepID=UPI001EF8BC54|nr:odorant receptor 47b-like [Diprion similis]
MKRRVTLRTAIKITKYTITPIASWPLPPEASTLEVVLHNFCWWFSILHTTLTSSAWFYNIYIHRDDPDTIIKVLSEIGAIYSTVFKMLICKIEAPRLQPLPGDAAYPFSIEPTWIWMILYASHSLIIVQVGCMAILDFMFAILLWYAGARFEMLGSEFQKATNESDVKRCVQKHQDLIKYVDKLKLTTRIMALEVTTIALFAVTTGGFVLIRVRLRLHLNTHITFMAKYIFFEIVSALELFLFTWPADNLIDKSEKVGYAAYNCTWEGKSPGMLQDLLIVMLRAKSPMIIAIDGLLPILSLELYGSTLSASFSYLTSLRAVAAT